MNTVLIGLILSCQTDTRWTTERIFAADWVQRLLWCVSVSQCVVNTENVSVWLCSVIHFASSVSFRRSSVIVYQALRSFTFTYHTWQFIIIFFIIFTITSHHLHLLLLVQPFTLNLRLGSSANHFLDRSFPFLPDCFHGLSDHLMFLSAQRLDLLAWCVRLSRL